nr:MAG TPA: DpnD/PcfM-like protein [Caudoviricetes sp.]
MNKYDVFVSECLERVVEVEAPDEATALRKVKTAYRNGEIVLTADDFVGDSTEFTAFKKEELSK